MKGSAIWSSILVPVMESEAAPSSDGLLVLDGSVGAAAAAAAADTRGKHRILAELKRLEQELKFLEDELQELDKTDSVSAICNVLLADIQRSSDPLLPETNGPLNPLWDLWFEGTPNSPDCRCWIL